jgi:hypothetical protein
LLVVGAGQLCDRDLGLFALFRNVKVEGEHPREPATTC